MDKRIAEIIVEACEENDVEASIYEDYSGRGMYGKTTTGVVVSGSACDVLVAVIQSAHLFCHECCESDEDALLNLRSIRQDNMGRDMIIY